MRRKHGVHLPVRADLHADVDAAEFSRVEPDLEALGAAIEALDELCVDLDRGGGRGLKLGADVLRRNVV